MPQDLFNVCVVTAAAIRAVSADLNNFHRNLAQYRREYSGEGANLEQDIAMCVEELFRMATTFNRHFGDVSAQQAKEDMIGLTASLVQGSTG
jgi:hypothetical protein